MPTGTKQAQPAFTMVTRRRGQRTRPGTPDHSEADTQEPRRATSAPPTPTPVRQRGPDLPAPDRSTITVGTGRPAQAAAAAAAGLTNAVADEAAKATGFFDRLRQAVARLEEILAPLQELSPAQADPLLKDLTAVLRKHCRPDQA